MKKSQEKKYTLEELQRCIDLAYRVGSDTMSKSQLEKEIKYIPKEVQFLFKSPYKNMMICTCRDRFFVGDKLINQIFANTNSVSEFRTKN